MDRRSTFRGSARRESPPRPFTPKRFRAGRRSPSRRRPPGIWRDELSGASWARSVSTPEAARSTPPTPRTTARCRLASSCPATVTTCWRRSRSAAGSERPILGRGAGTSLAGQCCNVAVVLDTSKYFNRILDDRPGEPAPHASSRASVLDDLREAAERHGLTFGPDPATHASCTLGGMIGNNSCGVHSVMAGKTDDNVQELEVVAGDGTLLTVGPTPDAELERILAGGGRPRRDLRADCATCATGTRPSSASRYPAIPRRVSGYNLAHLLPENGFDLARALVGSEGTCAFILEAKVRLVVSPPARVLVVLGYPRHLFGGRRGAGDPRSRADRPRGIRRRPRRRHGPERPLPGEPAAPPGGARLAPRRARRGGRARRARGARRGSSARSGREAPCRPASSIDGRRPRRSGRSGRPRSARRRTSPAGRGRGRAGRTPRSRPGSSARTCATCARSSTGTATAATSTATSGRGACTRAPTSTSRPPTGSRSIAPS